MRQQSPPPTNILDHVGLALDNAKQALKWVLHQENITPDQHTRATNALAILEGSPTDAQ